MVKHIRDVPGGGWWGGSRVAESPAQPSRVRANGNTIVYTHAVVNLEWDEANEAHIARHGVTPEDIEEALTDPRRIGGPCLSH